METPIIPSASITHKDRKVGLVIFGILTILFGVLCLLMCLFSVVTQISVLQKTPAAAPMMWQGLFLIVGMYGSIGVADIWLGIGSIMARRWARALILILSWSWLLIGIVTSIGMAVLFPKILAGMPRPENAHLPSNFGQIIQITVMAVMGVFFIILPLIWVLFYQGKNVKATCEALDPVPRWTDRCPLPVLAASMWMFLGAITLFSLAFVSHGVIPFFGMILSGAPGIAVYIFMGIIWLYCGFAFYRLDRRGWWLLLIFLILLFISYAITFSRHSMIEMMGIMYQNLPPEQMQDIMLYVQIVNASIWWNLLSNLLFIAYLLYIRKFFVKNVA